MAFDINTAKPEQKKSGFDMSTAKPYQEPQEKGFWEKTGDNLSNSWNSLKSAVEGDAQFKEAGNYKDYIYHLADKGFYKAPWYDIMADDPLTDIHKLDASGTFGNNDDIINRIQKINPDAVVKVDENGHRYIEEDGKQFYGNRPGLQGQDVVERLGEGATYMLGGLAGKAAEGLGLAPRMLATGSAESAINYGAQKMAGRENVDKTEVATAGLAGGLFEGLTPVISSMWRKFKNAGLSDVQAGKAVAREMGAELTDDQAANLGKMVKNYDPKKVTKETMLQHAELNQTPTLGTLTKDQNILDKEKMLRESGRKRTKEAFALVDQQNEDALSDIAKNAAPNFENRFQASSAIQESLQNKSNLMKDRANQAWDAIPDARAGTSSIKNAPQNIKNKFEQADFFIDEDITPAASKAYKKITEFTSNLGDDVDWNRINLERKRLGKMFNAAKTQEDKAALAMVKDEFEKTYKDAFEKQLLSGDPAVMKKLDQAVQASADYFNMFDGKDPTGRMVKSWLDNDVRPEQIADAFFTRQNGAIVKKAPQVAAKLKQILGKDSPEFQNVREMAVHGLMGGKDKDALRTSLKNALEKNPSFMSELFSPKELNFMSRTLTFLNDTSLKGIKGRSSGTTERFYRWLTNEAASDFSLSKLSSAIGSGVSKMLGVESKFLKAPTAQVFNPTIGLGAQGAVNHSNQ